MASVVVVSAGAPATANTELSVFSHVISRDVPNDCNFPVSEVWLKVQVVGGRGGGEKKKGGLNDF